MRVEIPLIQRLVLIRSLALALRMMAYVELTPPLRVEPIFFGAHPAGLVS